MISIHWLQLIIFLSKEEYYFSDCCSVSVFLYSTPILPKKIPCITRPKAARIDKQIIKPGINFRDNETNECS